ncbi:hypothetical protein [Paenibacillus sp. FSL M7-1455]|uniref:hypothetical protein n=1 Tax=Paenibacillus sp. FSL M7-1455 TaxID=2975316 RepID=UPI0040408514
MWVPGLLARYEPDSIRHFLIANGPERRDADFFVAQTDRSRALVRANRTLPDRGGNGASSAKLA